MPINYEQLAADYAASRAIHPAVLAHLLDAVTANTAQRILEVGSGTGNYIGALSAATDTDCWGVEPAAAMLATAAARYPQVRWRQGAAEELPLPDHSVDFIFTVDVIHHMTSVDDYFAEARRVLTPGGHICTVTDSAAIIAARQPLSHYWPATVAPELQRYPPIARLRTAMATAGFTNLQEEVVEHTYPLLNIEPYQRRAYSVLWLIPDDAWRAGLARLQADMAAGPVTAVARYLLLWGTR